ncbi:MAG: hypothetical protein AB1Z98_15670 [Nannocystaceae bacterium]
MPSHPAIVNRLVASVREQLVVHADMPEHGEIEVGEDFDVQLVARNTGRRGAFDDVAIRVFSTPFARIHGGLQSLDLEVGRLEPGQEAQHTVTMLCLDAVAGPELLMRARLDATIDLQSLLAVQSYHEFHGDVDDRTRLDEDARRFAEQMYDGILRSNFELRGWSFEAAGSLVGPPAELPWLRPAIQRALRTLGTQRGVEPGRIDRAVEQVEGAYLERFDESSASSRALALWFHSIDSDNWYSFDSVQAVADDYLSRSSRAGSMALVMVKGFDNDGLLARPVTTLDLPVVLNPARRTMTLWSATLND